METPIGDPSLAPLEHSKSENIALTLLLLGLSVLIGLLIVLPNFMRTRCGGTLTACKSNCKNLATALEMYSTDNKGLYPVTLDPLITGNYLRLIPTCPAAGRDTYTDYMSFKKRTRFRFSCVGNNHAKAYAGLSGSCDNLPAYDAELGLRDRP